ncbi:MAG: hypothetical protein SGILL_005700 [Bacillariaceae sp.]
MSDLANLVVATIRDQVVEDLQEENRILKEKLERAENRKMVKITGPNGTPVYARSNMEEDGSINGDTFVIDCAKFDGDAEITSWEVLKDMEIHIGNVSRRLVDPAPEMELFDVHFFDLPPPTGTVVDVRPHNTSIVSMMKWRCELPEGLPAYLGIGWERCNDLNTDDFEGWPDLFTLLREHNDAKINVKAIHLLCEALPSFMANQSQFPLSHQPFYYDGSDGESDDEDGTDDADALPSFMENLSLFPLPHQPFYYDASDGERGDQDGTDDS